VYSELGCQIACSWVGVGSFHTCLVTRFMIFTASVRNILDSSSYDEERDYSRDLVVDGKKKLE
jgi:hypothetical protein